MNLFNSIRKVFGYQTTPTDNALYDHITNNQYIIKSLTEELENLQVSHSEMQLELELKLQACDTLIDKGDDSDEVLLNKKRLHERLTQFHDECLLENRELVKALQDSIGEYEKLEKAIEDTLNNTTPFNKSFVDNNLALFQDGMLENVHSRDHALAQSLSSVSLAQPILDIVKATQQEFLDRYYNGDPKPSTGPGIVPSTTEKAEQETVPQKGSAAVILRNPDGKILFLKRSMDDDFHPGTWCLPGGGIDAGELASEAAYRELREEAGITCEEGDSLWLRNKIEVDGGKIIWYFDCYCSVDKYSMIALLDGESMNYAWLSRDEWEQEDLILDLKSHLRYMFSPSASGSTEVPTIKLEKGFFENDIEKGAKGDIGEEKTWGGHKYKKSKEGKWVSAGDPNKAKKKAKEKHKQLDDKELGEHAKTAKEKDLKKTVSEHTDEKYRTVANHELERRNGKEKPKDKKLSTKEKQEARDKKFLKEGKDTFPKIHKMIEKKTISSDHAVKHWKKHYKVSDEAARQALGGVGLIPDEEKKR